MIGTATDTCEAVFVYSKNRSAFPYTTGLRLVETPASVGAALRVSVAGNAEQRPIDAGLFASGRGGIQ
jgi:hypothetical protein